MPNLEDLVARTRLLSPPQLAVAKRDAEMRRTRLAQTIIGLGMVDDRRFAEWIANAANVPLIDPLPEESIRELHRRVPRAIAREYEVVPVELNGNRLTVAMVNPLDRDCIGILRTTTRLDIAPVVAVYGSLQTLISRFYPEDDVEGTILPPVDERADDSTGSSTKIIRPRAAEPEQDTNPVSELTPVSDERLARMERHLLDLVRAVEQLQRRLDAIESALSRVLTR